MTELRKKVEEIAEKCACEHYQEDDAKDIRILFDYIKELQRLADMFEVELQHERGYE